MRGSRYYAFALLVAVGCSSAAVRYKPYSGAELPMERWIGHWTEVPLVRAPSPDIWTARHDTLAEIEFDRYREETVSYGSSRVIRNNQYGRYAWRPAVSPSSCPSRVVVIPSDSIRPTRFYCPTPPRYQRSRDVRTTTRDVPIDPAEIQKLAWELGGHAVILTSVAGDTGRGYVIRCAVKDGMAECI